MNIPEMKLIAGAYSFDIRGLKTEGIFITDMKTGRYQKICDYDDYHSVTREYLVGVIREFSARLHKRNGSR